MEKIKIEIKNVKFLTPSNLKGVMDCGEVWFSDPSTPSGNGEMSGKFFRYLTCYKYDWTKAGEAKFNQLNQSLKAEGKDFDDVIDTLLETERMAGITLLKY